MVQMGSSHSADRHQQQMTGDIYIENFVFE